MAWNDRRGARQVGAQECIHPTSVAEQIVARIGLKQRGMPDAKLRNSDVAYLRLLITTTGLTQVEICKRLGIKRRTLQRYLSPSRPPALVPDYLVQYALERLAIRRVELNRLSRARRATKARSRE